MVIKKTITDVEAKAGAFCAGTAYYDDNIGELAIKIKGKWDVDNIVGLVWSARDGNSPSGYMVDYNSNTDITSIIFIGASSGMVINYQFFLLYKTSHLETGINKV